MTFDARKFRNALGLFPTGVAIVTTRSSDNERVGATVSSFSSVSLDPPLILFSIARSANSFETWQNAQYFAVNILSEDQSATSNRFAKSLTDKWEGVLHLNSSANIPLIAGSNASFECSHFAKYDGGDHLILVGRVTWYTTVGAVTPRPLLFYCGKYRQLDPGAAIETPGGVDHLLHGW
jgi:flavin reductase (DIM6/NTAB) family NADH-FMN oxidoreductase RutF